MVLWRAADDNQICTNCKHKQSFINSTHAFLWQMWQGADVQMWCTAHGSSFCKSIV